MKFCDRLEPSNSAEVLPQTRCLVIGFGNTLRSDDGAGYRVATTVLDWELEGVRSLPVHQLTPDLAGEIAIVQQVIFIDAIALDPHDPQLQSEHSELIFETLEPDSNSTFTGHHVDPRSLLFLAKTLYQSSPIAYQILIPAIDFQFGESFSNMTQQGVKSALAKVQQLLDSSPG